MHSPSKDIRSSIIVTNSMWRCLTINPEIKIMLGYKLTFSVDNNSSGPRPPTTACWGCRVESYNEITPTFGRNVS